MSDRKLTLEMQAAVRLKELLTAAYGDDTDLLRDSVEGQTNLHEAIGHAAVELAIVEGDKEGMEIVIAKLKERLTRYCKKAEGIRNAIQSAMEIAELTSLKTPTATLSLSPSQRSVEIIDLKAIPPVFMTQPAPVPDKKAISKALKEGQVIPGATLSNAPPSLTVRTK